MITSNFSELSSKEVKLIEENLEELYFTIGFNDEIEKFLELAKADSRKSVNVIGEKLYKRILKNVNEINRVREMYEFDKSFGNFIYVAGVDEVGRGPLAGPIVSASVILNNKIEDDKALILGIKDSKKLTPKLREELSEIIKSKALSFSIALLNNDEIDHKGISWCNNEVLRRASLGHKCAPDIVISDGYLVRNLEIQNKFIIQGDAKSASIAAASIIAKVYRDSLMHEYAKIYPGYAFENNMGYGTEAHIEGLRKYGPCKIHRRSFIKNFV